jgi:cell fate regulator YaaT (PSP1 superfamily)
VYDWLSGIGVSPPVHYDVVEVVFKGDRKAYYHNVSDLQLTAGDFVIVEADRGIDFGSVHMSGELVRLRLRGKGLEDTADFPNIIRRPTLEEIDRWEANREYEAESFHVARQAIDRLGLSMKLVDVEWQLDRNKVTFYFTADQRVDFRQLVRDLAGRFRTRVELRQIGARDEAARIGGIGSCGRELCCSTWLQEFQPVSTQAAKVQNLPLNPSRLSGQCGRLKCCLNYELEQYMTALEAFPPVETAVRTAYGKGRVQKIDIFKDIVWIQHADGTWEDKPLAEVRDILGIEEDEPARDIEVVGVPGGGGRRRGKPRSPRQ